jgi:hypothetical protein
MTDMTEKQIDAASPSEGLLRGGLGFLGGLLLCGAALAAQAAFLHSISTQGKKAN